MPSCDGGRVLRRRYLKWRLCDCSLSDVRAAGSRHIVPAVLKTASLLLSRQELHLLLLVSLLVVAHVKMVLVSEPRLKPFVVAVLAAETAHAA